MLETLVLFLGIIIIIETFNNFKSGIDYDSWYFKTINRNYLKSITKKQLFLASRLKSKKLSKRNVQILVCTVALLLLFMQSCICLAKNSEYVGLEAG